MARHMRRFIKVNNKKIGESQPSFIVAEISANHAQDIALAIKMIRKAAECGADAVKFQTYTPDTITINSDNHYFKIKHSKWRGQTLYDLYKKAYTPWSWFKKLKKITEEEGLVFFSTAFDKTAVDFLEGIGVPFHKVASFELVDLPLIEYMAKTGKPLILSTGMATLIEIRDAVNAAKKAGAKEIILLKCVSNYPANPEDMNLRTLQSMRDMFNYPVGISDHTLGIGVSIAAVCLGAVMIEKHFTLSRKIKTPDSFFSIEPEELAQLVINVRVSEKALGKPGFKLTADEKKNRIFRRSLFAANNIRKESIFTEQNIRSIRPAFGLPPKELSRILGKKAKRDIKKGTPLEWGLVGKK